MLRPASVDKRDDYITSKSSLDYRLNRVIPTFRSISCGTRGACVRNWLSASRDDPEATSNEHNDDTYERSIRAQSRRWLIKGSNAVEVEMVPVWGDER